MSRASILKSKSFDFAVRIVRLCRYLGKTHSEYVISQQLIRSGSAIGALIREAEHAESRKDFIHKLTIALKEANESLYWLELLSASGYLSKRMFDSINNDGIELLKMLISSIKTLKVRS